MKEIPTARKMKVVDAMKIALLLPWTQVAHAFVAPRRSSCLHVSTGWRRTSKGAAELTALASHNTEGAAFESSKSSSLKSSSSNNYYSGTYSAFAETAWKQLEQTPGLEPVDLDPDYTSRLVPAKTPKEDYVVRMTARALQASSSSSSGSSSIPIRYARMVLLETIPFSTTTATAESTSLSTNVSTAGIQVLNLVIFPNTNSNLPVWGADFVSLPGNKHLILLDAQPMALDVDANEVYARKFQSWHETHVNQQFPWGGTMPEAVLPYVSKHALWTRFGGKDGDKDDNPLPTIQGPLLQAFEEHLHIYLQLLSEQKDNIVVATAAEGGANSINHQADYITYRVNNDPAKPMLKSLFGQEWTDYMLHQVLFPQQESKTNVTSSSGAGESNFSSVASVDDNSSTVPPPPLPSKFFVDSVNNNDSVDHDDDENKVDETSTISTKIQVSGLPWKASQQEIVQHFSSFGQLVFCKVLAGNDGQTTGTALLEFRDVGAAIQAVKTNGMDYFGEGILSIKYGHYIAKEKPTVTRLNQASPVFRSSRTASKRQPETSSDTKIYIRGLPWKLSNQEVIQHFASCGEIFACKLTLGGDGLAKGEASMEFAHADGAAAALKMDGSDYYGYGRLSVQYELPPPDTKQTSSSSFDKDQTADMAPLKSAESTITTNVDKDVVDKVEEPQQLRESSVDAASMVQGELAGDNIEFRNSTEPDVPEELEAVSVSLNDESESHSEPPKAELSEAYDVVTQWDEIYKALEGDKQELVTLRSRLDTLEQENKALHQELSATSVVVSQWEDKYNKMSVDRDSFSSRSETLQKENEGLRKELSSVNDVVSQSGVTSKELEALREKMNARVESLEKENLNLQSLLDKANETAAIADQKYNEIVAKQKDADARLEMLEKKNAELQNRMSISKNATVISDEKYKKVESERDELLQRVETLENENGKLKTANVSASEAQSEIDDKLKLLQYNQTKLLERVDTLGKENTELKTELASSSEVASNEFQKSIGLEEARRKLQKRADALEKENTNIKRELTSISAKASQSDEDVKDLFEERKNMLALIDQQESENKGLEEKVKLTSEEVSLWKEKYMALEKEREEYIASLPSAEGQSTSSSSKGSTRDDFFVSQGRPDERETPARNNQRSEAQPREEAELEAEMEAKIRFLEEKIAREERRMQERAGDRPPPEQGRASSRGGSVKLVVTGLNWRMSREEVYQQFSTFGELVSCELPLHADGQPVGKALLEFADPESAQRAMMMNGDIFGPGTLSIQFDTSSAKPSNRPASPRQSVVSSRSGNERYGSHHAAPTGGAAAASDRVVPPYRKIQIGGLPWRTQKQDLMDYFSTFGPINSCNLQVQGDGRSSGSATIEFGNAESAARAMQMNGREYYGDARLSIQYLSPSGAPIDMRAKPKPNTQSLADEDTSWYN
ncbi:hypothetical protein MPSEU_000047800 [Mayamaea pseudoterrestris]|nr:hypothetical protein MPSEU_000047800 [Mayamaea pseudoterrestris]